MVTHGFYTHTRFFACQHSGLRGVFMPLHYGTGHTKLAPRKVPQRIISPQGDVTISRLELTAALLASMVDNMQS